MRRRLFAAVRAAGLVAVAGLTLAACTNVGAVVVTGTPALSIDVPLTSAGCLTTGRFCVAFGTTATSGPLTSTAEAFTPATGWRALGVPSALNANLVATTCSAERCLTAGVASNHDLLWLSDPADSSVVLPLNGPTGGAGVHAVNCQANGDCVLVDTGAASGLARIAFSADNGATWTTPRTVSKSSSLNVTSVACTANDASCVAVANVGSTSVSLRTRDEGRTWFLGERLRWSSVRDLHCVGGSCTALATNATSSYLLTSRNLGQSWHQSSLNHVATALSCTSINHCVAVGATNQQGGWLATVHDGQTNVATLRYVPSSLGDVSCSTTRCLAIGVTTVAVFRPTY